LLIQAAKALVSLSILAVLFSRIDGTAIIPLMARMNLANIGLVTGVVAIHTSLVAWRWQIVMRMLEVTMPFSQTLRVFLTGQWFAQVLPAIGAEVVRSILVQRIGETRFRQAVTSVVLDRLAALAGLAILVALILPLGARFTNQPALVTALAGTGALIAVAIVGVLYAGRIAGYFGSNRIVSAFHYMGEAVREALRRWTWLAPVLGLSIVGHLLSVLTVWILAKGIGLELGLTAGLVAIPPAILAAALPVAINGWGVREGTMVITLGWVGFAPEEGLALSVLYGITASAVGLIGGIVWLVQKRKPAREGDRSGAG